MRKARSRCLFVDCTDTVAGAAMRKRQAGPLDRSPRRRDVHLSRNRDEIRASSQFLQTLFSITSSDTELKVSEKFEGATDSVGHEKTEMNENAF